MPSSTFATLVADAVSYDPEDPRGREALAVSLDRAMEEGLFLEIGGVQAYPGARPSPVIRVTAAQIAAFGIRS